MQTHQTNIRRSTILIPYQVCQWVTNNRFHKAFQLYLLLNTSCSGKRRISNDEIQAIADTLCVCSKTVRNNLRKLRAHNWVGYNTRSKYYFIRGFEKIKSMYGFDSRLCVEFDMQHIAQSKVFTESALIGYLVNSQYRKIKKQARNNVERNSIRSNHAEITTPESYPVSNIGASKCLHVAKSKVYRIKRDGNYAGFITVEKCYTQTGVNVTQFDAFVRGNPELRNRIRIKGDQILITKTDMVSHSIRFKNKRTPLSKRLVK